MSSLSQWLRSLFGDHCVEPIPEDEPEPLIWEEYLSQRRKPSTKREAV